MIDQLLHSISHFSFLVFLICAVILFFWGNKDTSTRVLGATVLAGGLFALAFLLINYGVIEPPVTVLVPQILISGSFVSLFMLYYPVALLRPRWMRLRYFLLSLLPLLFMLSLLAIAHLSGIEYTPLHSFSEVMAHLEEPNVKLRLLMLVTPYFYEIMLVIFGIRALRDMTPYKRIVIFCLVGVIGIGFSYLLSNLFFPAIGKLFNQIYSMLYAIFATYFVYTDTVRRNYTAPRPFSLPELPANEETKILPLDERLKHVMQREKLYLDPELTLPSLAARLNTNRTTLSQVLRESERKSFTPYLNCLRVEEACRIIDQGYTGRIEDLGYSVGFSSKTSFLRNFRERTGTTPGQYLTDSKS